MKDRRREVRLSSREDDLIVEAAGLVGVSASEFLLDRAIADARATVEGHHAISLTADDHARFIAALDRPCPPPQDLVDQIRKARVLKQVD